MFHTVHVVSIEDVTTRLGDFSFQEKFVSGAPVDPFCTLLCCGDSFSAGIQQEDKGNAPQIMQLLVTDGAHLRSQASQHIVSFPAAHHSHIPKPSTHLPSLPTVPTLPPFDSN